MLSRELWHPRLTDAVVLDAVRRHNTSLDDPGLCLACGAERGGTEPDARRYPCESCGERQVYGSEELLVSL